MRRQWQGERGSFWKNHMTEHILHSSTKLKLLEENVFRMWLSHILWQMCLSEGEVSGLCSLCWRLSYFTNWPFCAMQRGSACNRCATASGPHVGLCRQRDGRAWGQRVSEGGFKKIQWKDWVSWPWSTLPHIWVMTKEAKWKTATADGLRAALVITKEHT